MKRKLLQAAFIIAVCLGTSSCIGCSSSSDSDNYDENYWNSVNREQALRDAGLDGAANIERKARQDYMQGGGYTSPYGGRQVHYNGSKEQQEDLRMMDAYGW